MLQEVPLKLSARNQIVGTVKSVKEGGVMAEVIVEIAGGHELVSVITVTSRRAWGLRPASRLSS